MIFCDIMIMVRLGYVQLYYSLDFPEFFIVIPLRKRFICVCDRCYLQDKRASLSSWWRMCRSEGFLLLYKNVKKYFKKRSDWKWFSLTKRFFFSLLMSGKRSFGFTKYVRFWIQLIKISFLKFNGTVFHTLVLSDIVGL